MNVSPKRGVRRNRVFGGRGRCGAGQAPPLRRHRRGADHHL